MTIKLISVKGVKQILQRCSDPYLKMAKFNPGRTQSVLWSYLKELILLMAGCTSEVEFSPRMSTGLIQDLDEGEALLCWVQ